MNWDVAFFTLAGLVVGFALGAIAQKCVNQQENYQRLDHRLQALENDRDLLEFEFEEASVLDDEDDDDPWNLRGSGDPCVN